MVPQYNHILLTSFYLWLDYKLCNDQQAFITRTGLLYPQSDPSLGSTYAYASPYKQWIYDSSVTGAVVPSGFYNAQGQFLTRSSGLVIDFINGRVLSATNLGGPLSGIFCTKEINLYQSNERVVNWWMENVYATNPDLSYTQTGNDPNRFYAPCIIITASQGNNRPFALGGVDDTHKTFRLYTITRDNYLQEAVGSYISDLDRRYIPFGNYADMPINTYGDLKTGYFSYQNIMQEYGFTGGLYIQSVNDYRLSERYNKNMGYNLSIQELDTSKIRVPSLV